MRKTIFILILFAANSTAWSQVNDSTVSPAPVIVTPVDSVFVAADTSNVLPDYMIYCDSGIASWYGPKWKGRLTASGEYFDPDSLTAAHKTLPFGTIVRVTNLTNDSVVYVRITDRLPRSSSRSIDLTPTAAKQLGFYSKGLQKVKIESCGMIPVQRKKTSCGPGAYATNGTK